MNDYLINFPETAVYNDILHDPSFKLDWLDTYELDGYQWSYPDYPDVYILSGNYLGVELTDEELEHINDKFFDEIRELCLDAYQDGDYTFGPDLEGPCFD